MKNNLVKWLKNLVHPFGIIGLVLSVAIPVIIYLLPNLEEKGILKNLDLYLPLPLFGVQFIVGITLFVFLRKDFLEWFKGILPDKKYSFLMIFFTAVITIFAASQIEARHRVQSDESIFLSIAQNMYYNQESGTCNQGIFEKGDLNCKATSNSFKTKGLAFLYLLGMPFFGNDLKWIFNLELLFLPLAILLMFLAIVAWTREPLLAFFASLLMALQPTVLFQFRSMSVEPLYILLSALALFFFKWAYDKNSVKHWVLLALILGFFAQTRQETVFCLLPFIFFAFPKILDKKDAKAPAYFLTLSLASIPVLITISYFQGFGFQGGEFSAHGHFLEDLQKNWEVMTKPLNDKGELTNPFLSYFNYIFAAGLIYLLCRALFDAFAQKKFFYLKLLVFLALYHIQTYVILENVSGDFTIEINQRYSLVMLPSMAFLAAFPIAHLLQELTASLKNNIVAVLLVGLAFTAWTGHYKEDFNNNIMYNRNHLTTEEAEIWKWLNEQPDKKRFFIYGRPWHFVGYGISSIHYDRARQMNDDEWRKIIDDYEGEVYYLRGLDCWDSKTYHKKAVEHRIPSTCDFFEKEMDLTGVKNILITRSYWLQIAKFNGRKNLNAENLIQIQEPVFEKMPEKKSLHEVDENTDVNKIVTDSLRLKYALKNVKETDLKFRLIVNNKVEKEEPFTAGEFNTALSEEILQPGYNHILYRIDDLNTGKNFANISQYYFNEANGVIALENVDYKSHRQDWGKFKKNLSIDGKTMRVGGSPYSHGFSVHASSETVYALDKKYSSVRLSYGLDDESLCSEGVQIQILGDGKILAETLPFKNGNLQTITANTSNINELTLKTIPVGHINCSHVDIIHPVLIP